MDNEARDKGWGGTPQASDTGGAGQGWGGTPQASDTGGAGQGWGGTPQASDTGGAGQGWGGAPQASDTGAAGQSWGGAPQASDTGAEQAASSQYEEAPERSRYEMDGKIYEFVSVISSTSGEARVFEVKNNGQRYALKLYRRGIHPNHEVLDRVMKLRGNGYLIDIYSHGIWKDPETGTEHDYEVMEYCAGGSLADLKLTGDEKRMREVALRMADILDYAHKHGILHRDVKPANFLFTDCTRKKFVLTDWGLAKLLDEKGRTVTDSGRTKIYAAPEMYIYIWGKNTYVGPKADFFSMGMTLMALWMGEGILIADERQLVTDKQEETLRYPSAGEMNRSLLGLIKGLTRRNPEKRVGIEEIRKWEKDRNFQFETGSTVKEDLHQFRMVFSAKDKLIAHNPEELGRLMWDNRELAIKYLYHGEIYKWLREADNSELAVDIDNITEELYPDDRYAGLFAACLLLNPHTVLEGLDGKALPTVQDVAKELLENQTAYKKLLAGKEHTPLWDYLRSRKYGDRVDEFRRWIDLDGETGVRAIAYTLDPELPFLFRLKSRAVANPTSGVTGNGVHSLLQRLIEKKRQDSPKAKETVESKTVTASTLPELAALLAADAIEINPAACRIDFKVWAFARNPEIREPDEFFNNRLEGYDVAKRNTYAVLTGYGMDYLPKDESSCYYPAAIATLLMKRVEAESGDSESSDVLSEDYAEDVINYQVVPYLKARELDRDVLENIESLGEGTWDDLHYGPYNENILLMKVAWLVNGGPVSLHVRNEVFRRPDDVSYARVKNFTEDEQTLVADWLSLFWQENPMRQFNEKTSYEETSKYLDFIEGRLHESRYYKARLPRLTAIRKAETSRDRALSRVRMWKWVVTLLGFLPLAIAVAVGYYTVITKGSVDIGDTMRTVGLWTGVVIGAIAAIAYIADKGGWIVGVIIGVVVAALIKAALVFIAPAVPWIILGCFTAFLIWWPFRIFISVPQGNMRSDIPLAERIRRVEIDEAFEGNSKAFDSSWDTPESVYNRKANLANGTSTSILKRSVWLVVATVCAVLFSIWISNMGTAPGHTASETAGTELLEGRFSGDVAGTPLTVEFGRAGSQVTADMRIRYRSGLTEQIMRGEAVNSFPLAMPKSDNSNIVLTIDTVYASDGKVVAQGSYLNSKGNRKMVVLTK